MASAAWVPSRSTGPWLPLTIWNTMGTSQCPSVGRAMAPPWALRGPRRHGQSTSQLQFSRYSPSMRQDSAMSFTSGMSTRPWSHDALLRERGEIVAREPEAPAVDLLVVGAHRRGAGARDAPRRAREPGHDGGHPQDRAVRAGNGDEVLPRPHVRVREDVPHAV